MLQIFVLIFGLVIGSFIAAYSYRYPRGISIADGFSFCDKCKRKIMWYENIPVVSYLFLGGKCFKCKKTISPRYPIIEFVSGLVFVLLFKYNSSVFDLNFILLIIYYLLLSLIFIIDFENQIIPDTFVFFGLVFLFFLMLVSNDQNIYSSLASGFISSAFLMVINLLTKGRGMGLGDVKFALFGGILVGIDNLFMWFFIAFLTGAGVGIILILLKAAKLKDKIAFGPFLVVSIPVSLVWGQKIWSFVGMYLH